MLRVSELYIYPIKSLAGIAVTSASVTDRGFKYDRRWMLVDEDNCFLTQRELPHMALLQVELTQDGLKVYHKNNIHTQIIVPPAEKTNETSTVKIWNDECNARFVSKLVDECFSQILSHKCRLVYMPYTTKRRIDETYSLNKEITSFSDSHPILIIGQSSLDDLNDRLTDPLPINRFRPNIVFTGGDPFEEDVMEHFTINDINFYGVKLCARCMITTINQDDGVAAKEPLKTLATYRMRNNNVYFGQNLLHHGEGFVSVGDAIKIRKKKLSGSLTTDYA
ncbi:MAG: MOSC N-terminal beta barrel domain-containing protein [Ginsengibacter sp.]